MSNIPTPCHILDLDKLNENLKRIQEFKKESNCLVFLAVKGFSAPYLFDIMKPFLDGVSASGLFEARLGFEEFGKQVQTYSPAFKDEEISEIVRFSDTVIFNSTYQYKKYKAIAKRFNCTCGIRINPQISSTKKKDADPCRISSHLGIPINDFPIELFEKIDGIHFHALCEQDASAFEDLVNRIVLRFGSNLSKLKWINFGGGQMIGNEMFDIHRAAKCLKYINEEFGIKTIIEPCEGIFSNVGCFATKVLDIIENNGHIAILDSSPVCHMQDAVFRGWTRDIAEESDDENTAYKYKLCGQTCFAGDSFGWYWFKKPLKIGDILHFKDTATYTWVKNNAFNGIPYPTICTFKKNTGLQVVKEYNYQDFYKAL